MIKKIIENLKSNIDQQYCQLKNFPCPNCNKPKKSTMEEILWGYQCQECDDVADSCYRN